MINDEELAGENVERYSALFDVVISTIPLWSICLKPKEHQFKSIPIFVSKTMEYTGLPDVWTKDQGSVVYNGSEHGDWYRTSYIFGHTSTEYKASRDLYDQHYFGKHRMDLGFKVAGTTCDCHPLVHKAGRMGRWERGILTHHAFEGAIEALSDVAVRRPPA
jgi:hypothetical protein